MLLPGLGHLLKLSLVNLFLILLSWIRVLLDQMLGSPKTNLILFFSLVRNLHHLLACLDRSLLTLQSRSLSLDLGNREKDVVGQDQEVVFLSGRC